MDTFVNLTHKEPYTLEALANYIENTGEMGIYGEYFYMSRNVWNKYREKYSMNEILSFMRKYNIRRIYVYSNYGVKKIGIWL